CEQVGGDIRISRNNGPKYVLTSSCRDAGHGKRQYKMSCVSSTKYQVEWTTPASCTNIDQDTTNPQVLVSASKSSVQNNESVTITATASDSKGVTKIELYEDSSLIKTCNNTTSCAYTFTAQSSVSTERTRVFKAKAYDAAGNTSNSSAVVVRISPTKDMIKPDVTVSVSATSITSGRQVTVTSHASDASGISKIELYRNGERVKTCTNTTSCVYSITLTVPSWATSQTNKFHARATDKNGNERTSSTKEVRVTR
ncbi:MAG TPA: Ig-like domain-containing protein, partial [Candidatus Magasanikbacteria bacterium]|nr:Ig-like domain-containing protein [Candidatus Magasanikbacteria bacterium]